MNRARARGSPPTQVPSAAGGFTAVVFLIVLWTSSCPGAERAQPVSQRTLADRHVEEGEALFRKGRFEQARAAFQAAASLDAQWVVPRYYLAYLDYKLGNLEAARRGFEQALALDATDGWSRYMLGLTLAKLGNLNEARTELEAILRANPEQDLEQTTRSTLDEITRLAHPTPPQLTPWTASTSVAVAFDTNPAYIADRVIAGAPGTAADLVLKGAGEYRRSLTNNLRMFTGGQVHGQVIVANRQDADWTAISFWTGVSRPGRPVSVLAEYTYNYSIFGGDPYLSVHGLFSAVEFREAPWTASRIETALAARNSQKAAFSYLDSVEFSFAAGQVVSVAGGDWIISLLYAVVRDWADDFSQRFSSLEGSATVENLYKTNYSFVGHGPVLSVRGRLPGSLHFSFRLGYLWKGFDDPDILASRTGTHSTVVTKERTDRRLTFDITLSRPLNKRLSVFFSFSSLDNFSTLGEEPKDFVDRNYSRRMGSLGILYTFP